MSKSVFEILIALIGLAFAIAFCVIVVPPLLASGDVIGAFGAGFVNPYASGYSLDAILSAFILLVWVIYERNARGVKNGWIAILLALVPGVATGFAAYLILRSRTHGAKIPAASVASE